MNDLINAAGEFLKEILRVVILGESDDVTNENDNEKASDN